MEPMEQRSPVITCKANCLESTPMQTFADFDPQKVEAIVQSTIEQYGLFDKQDKVLVACSGGKDSTVLLHILKKLGYDVEAITVNAHIGCYTEENLKNLRQICEKINVKLHEISFKKEFGNSLCNIQNLLKEKGYDYKSCHTCGVLRRYLLNKYSKQINPDVIATGHNIDDEAQAIMMNLFRGNIQVCARLGPKTGIVEQKKSPGQDQKRKFVQRVKPLYLVKESDVVKYAKLKQFPVQYGECPCSSDTYRREMKNMFLGLGGPEKQEAIKAQIVQSFLSVAGKLKEHFAQQEDCVIQECVICGEPSSKEVCNTCSLLGKIKEKS